MLKRTLFSAALSVIATASMAGGVDTYHKPVMPRDHFYVGAGLGADAQSMHTATSGLTTQHEDVGDAAVLGRVFVGYHHHFTPRYGLSTAFYFQGQGLKSQFVQNNSAAASNLETHYQFGLKLMPTIRVNASTDIFAAAGLSWTHMEYNSSTLAIAGGAASSYNTTKPALLLGVGASTMIAENWSLRGEYDHVSTKTWTITAAGVTSEFRPSSNQYTASVAYHFSW